MTVKAGTGIRKGTLTKAGPGRDKEDQALSIQWNRIHIRLTMKDHQAHTHVKHRRASLQEMVSVRIRTELLRASRKGLSVSRLDRIDTYRQLHLSEMSTNSSRDLVL